jgi:hypothetical protein
MGGGRVRDFGNIILITLGTIILTGLSLNLVITLVDWGLTITGN